MKQLIVDVREPDEFSSGHVNGALNIPLSQLNAQNPQLHQIAKNQPLVLYCRSGNRSAMAIQILTSLGFTDLTNGINQQTIEQNL